MHIIDELISTVLPTNNKEARILLTENLAFTTDNKKFMSTWERRKIKKTDFFGKGKSFVKSCDIFLLIYGL